MSVTDKLKERLGIRSPSLAAIGHYDCEQCAFHEECICVVCEDGQTVVCAIAHKHVKRNHTCKYFKRIGDT